MYLLSDDDDDDDALSFSDDDDDDEDACIFFAENKNPFSIDQRTPPKKDKGSDRRDFRRA